MPARESVFNCLNKLMNPDFSAGIVAIGPQWHSGSLDLIIWQPEIYEGYQELDKYTEL